MLPNARLHQSAINALPVFTRVATKPLPGPVVAFALGQAFNTLFKPDIRGGKLAFLHKRRLAVEIPDLALRFSLTLIGQRLRVSTGTTPGDVSFKADHDALTLILTGRADPDTLFFQRRLRISGDTELGLEIKNFLDSLEPEQRLPRPLYRLLNRYADQRQRR